MKRLVKKVESLEDTKRVWTYYFMDKIPYLKKEKCFNYRKTFLFGLCISKHFSNDKIIKNNIDYNDIFSSQNQNIDTKTKIDIIIPIYNGFEYLEELFNSIYKNTDCKYHIIAINDCSTDERIKAFLLKQQKVFKNKLTVITNEENLGFVKSVNKGLANAQNHVCLLNTDVILPSNWASRLFSPILKNDKVASVTPFSNAATIFSIPIMCFDNNFDGDLEKINNSISKINSTYKNIAFPTGVGFCMAINKEALDKIGIFDEIFEKGYGEENDWCQRAIKAGYINTIASNLFVWHKHGGTFNHNEKQKLIKKHIEVIEQRYPSYSKDVQKTINSECYNSLHLLIELLYFNASAKKTEIWFDHTWGGGTEIYSQRQIHTLKNEKLILRLQDCNYGIFKLKYFYKNFENSIYINYDDFFILCSNMQIEKIVLNNIAGYGDYKKILEYINNLKLQNSCKISFRGHDYQCICPTIVMMNATEQYCNCKNTNNCKQCFQQIKKPAIKIKSIVDYQKTWHNFLDNVADEIIVFSNSTKNILSQIYPEIDHKIKIIPHEIPYIPTANITKHKGINIAVLGNIGIPKGANIVKEIDKLLPSYKEVSMVIIGKCEYKLKNSIVLGEYTLESLPKIMEKHLIDVVLIPSIWPETFSYTTSEAMNMKLAVACFNLGAPAERVKLYEKGIILEQFDAKYIVEKLLEYLNT